MGGRVPSGRHVFVRYRGTEFGYTVLLSMGTVMHETHSPNGFLTSGFFDASIGSLHSTSTFSTSQNPKPP